MYKNTRCKLQAHRGVSTDCPENTMAAFREAVSQGYDLIEFDPKFTRDGEIVVLHDWSLNRTGRIAGEKFTEEVKITDVDFSFLADVDVGEWFDGRFTGVHVPTLSQALDYMKYAEVEAKIDNVVQSFPPEMQQKTFDIVEKHGLSGKVGLTCSDLKLLEKFALRFPTAPLHYDGAVSEEALEKLKCFSSGHDTTVWMRFDNAATSWNKTPPVNREYARLVHENFKLGIWILSADPEMEKALDFNPDIVETTGGIKP